MVSRGVAKSDVTQKTTVMTFDLHCSWIVRRVSGEMLGCLVFGWTVILKIWSFKLDSLNLKPLNIPPRVRIGGDGFGVEAGGFSGAGDGPFHAFSIGGDRVLVGGDGEEVEHFVEIGGGEVGGGNDLDFWGKRRLTRRAARWESEGEALIVRLYQAASLPLLSVASARGFSLKLAAFPRVWPLPTRKSFGDRTRVRRQGQPGHL
jgi:hypothetical protein